MSPDSKYSQLAIDGKWISLAKLWITENSPCSRDKMFTELGMLMPSTVRRGERLASRSSLVSEAYMMLYKTKQIPEQIEKYKVKTTLRNGSTDKIRVALSEKETVSLSDLRHLKSHSRLILWLLKKGECERVSVGVYRKTSLLKIPVVESTPAGS